MLVTWCAFCEALRQVTPEGYCRYCERKVDVPLSSNKDVKESK